MMVADLLERLSTGDNWRLICPPLVKSESTYLLSPSRNKKSTLALTD